MVITMINFLFYILKFSVKYYNIKNLDEFEELLILKQLNYKRNKPSKGVIVYIDKEIIIDIVKQIKNQKIYTANGYIATPASYIIVKLPQIKFNVNTFITVIICFLSISLSLFSFNLALLCLVLTIFIRGNSISYLVTTVNILLLHYYLYSNHYIIISLMLVVVSIVFYKPLLLAVIIPMMIINNIYNYYLIILLVISAIVYLLFLKLERNNYEKLLLKVIIKERITKVNTVEIDGKVISKNGRFFYELSNNSYIKINGINFKFVALEMLSDYLEIVYIRNRNSFFTNRRKYSKIVKSNKIYIYLVEGD